MAKGMFLPVVQSFKHTGWKQLRNSTQIQRKQCIVINK